MRLRQTPDICMMMSLGLALAAGLSPAFLPVELNPGSHAACARARPPALEPATVNLIYQLSAHPELIDLAYLRHIVGSPANQRSQLASTTRDYYWYQEPKRLVSYQLHQDGPHNGAVTRRVFTIAVPNSRLTIRELERLFGHERRRVFDQQSYPTDMYCFGPNTYVAFTQPTDSFRVQKIQVGYEGPPLPPPGKEAICQAYQFGLNRAPGLAAISGNWQEALAWLRREAAVNPDDAYVHLKLAAAYRAGFMLNEAISEYAKAAQLGAGDLQVDEICRAALAELRVLPGQEGSAPDRRRNYLAGQGGRAPGP